MNEPTPINCLRCRHCSLTPDTDMSRRDTPIQCAIFGQRQINLHGCAAADPRPAYFQRRYHHNGSRVEGSDGVRWWSGDKLKPVGAVEAAFLRAHYATARWELLQRLTGRSRGVLVNAAKKLGLVRRPDWGAVQRRNWRECPGKAARLWTPAQRACVAEAMDGPDWPSNGYSAAKEAAKARIVATVNALGPERTWTAINYEAHLQRPGSRKPEYLAARRAAGRRYRARRRSARSAIS